MPRHETVGILDQRAQQALLGNAAIGGIDHAHGRNCARQCCRHAQDLAETAVKIVPRDIRRREDAKCIGRLACRNLDQPLATGPLLAGKRGSSFKPSHLGQGVARRDDQAAFRRIDRCRSLQHLHIARPPCRQPRPLAEAQTQDDGVGAWCRIGCRNQDQDRAGWQVGRGIGHGRKVVALAVDL